jgi:hypothetical protein
MCNNVCLARAFSALKNGGFPFLALLKPSEDSRTRTVVAVMTTKRGI